MAQAGTPIPAPTAPQGKNTIVDPVVAKIAGIAAREVPGVHALGGGAARIIGNVRDALGSTDLTQGVKVEVGETEVAADVTIVVEYPQPLQTVAEGVRAAVADAITGLIGMQVAEINVIVTDVHVPGEEPAETAESPARVQ
ncbi:Asp23/Gls24 family envelope stress response protein [Schumannella sp. 10F1B-5-1]|uniref:Asp23/Gls24 family envelope stress response protein n=1 Tax=Schumannella sp. 10F1B-5-1 TaxID=2590780 RepID=UPI0011310685|nr:Asp23/Gls24 family envelope stress response protein [Schumannella sp. 10F1B-5-1]TPW71677.1 Asp23/Gls24 family envelope stress response protein [Schumannella sp. 10F1B-5-1]